MASKKESRLRKTADKPILAKGSGHGKAITPSVLMDIPVPYSSMSRKDLEIRLAELEAENARLRGPLTSSQGYFRHLYDSANLGVYQTTPDGRILYANPALIKMLGFDSFEDLARRNLEEGGFEPDYPRAEFKRTIEETGSVSGLESQWICRDGKRIWVRENAVLMRDEEEYVLCYEGIVEDLSDRKQVELALQESQWLLQTTFDTIQEGISVLDTDLNIVRTNTAMERWYASAMPLQGRKCYLCYHEAQVPCEGCPALRCMKTGQPASHVVPGVPGTQKWFELLTYPLRHDPQGPVEGVIELVIDVTERKRYEADLRASEERFRLVTEATRDYIFDWNLLTGVRWRNEKLRQFYGIADEGDGLLHVWKEHLHPEDRKQVVHKIESLLAGHEQYWNIAYRLRRLDSSYADVIERAFIVRDEQGTALRVLGAVADITVQKRAEQQLLDYQSRLQRLATQLTLTEERERRRVAEHLHDQVAQTLVFINMKLERLAKNTPDEALRREHLQLSAMLKELVRETRTLTFELSSPVLRQLGLACAIDGW
ncbi:PAS domain S-box protein, partial [Planctomycetota bacterium]